MQLDISTVFKKDVHTVADFSRLYANGIKPQSVYYAMDNGLIDFIVLGDRRYVVMTNRTKEYKPNESPARTKKKKAKKK